MNNDAQMFDFCEKYKLSSKIDWLALSKNMLKSYGINPDEFINEPTKPWPANSTSFWDLCP